MVFSGLYPVDGDDYPDLRDALDKLRLNDAALVYEPETSDALGFGFRCGFLGLLHMEIVRERLEREFDLSLISTAPNAVYRVVMDTGQELRVTNPSDFPGGSRCRRQARSRPVFEPVVRATIISPAEYIGTIMELCQSRRGALIGMDYLSADRVEIRYTLPLAEIIFDFFDQLKSRTRGYASLDYEPDGEQQADLVKVDILLQGQPVDAFSQIVHADEAREYGLSMTAKLKELIPRQQYEVPIQAAVGARIIARENIRALRKDVLAKCYGGDITRKRKLLERQKEGKKRMKTIGRVDVPQEAFVAALSTQPSRPQAAIKSRTFYRTEPWWLSRRLPSRPPSRTARTGAFSGPACWMNGVRFTCWNRGYDHALGVRGDDRGDQRGQGEDHQRGDDQRGGRPPGGWRRGLRRDQGAGPVRELRVGQRPDGQVRGQRPQLPVGARRVGLRHPLVELVLGQPPLGETGPQHAHGPLPVRAGREPGGVDADRPQAPGG